VGKPVVVLVELLEELLELFLKALLAIELFYTLVFRNMSGNKIQQCFETANTA
jgi:hypothetical protein